MKTGIPFRLLQTSAILLMASMVTNSVRAEKAHRVIAEGQARVVDGDTLVVGGKEITLYGIDAPELKQTCEFRKKTIRCGVLSSDALRDLITGARKVSCTDRGRDREGLRLGLCSADGFDIGRNMVHTGWALAWRRYSRMYIKVEEKAMAAKRGLWRGPFDKPWKWRKNQ
ncbi:MAG: thermonuclease family protein [Alphaproteobacteria bacterium]|jgi:endonuclease YncB( thermonuclease family)|nr:thermonuclease family protein [Alphaproteobacteria bacterium]MBT4018331.1 thermonuclease family protein [Alphaproteobacteria bacterium]MBT4966833.1 thermonuclease family protein [Alphaproteobacteria bacterium]MBT5160705.1 thermonuclease family protein [Alphaproteobacteria bacterium]